jgi:replicative DNA helicase
MGKLEEMGGPAYLVTLASLEKIVTTVNVEKYARTVLEKYISREIIKICQEHSLRGFEDAIDPFEQATELEAQVSSLVEMKHGKSRKFRTIEAVSNETIKMLNEVGKQKSPGLSFGLRDVDEMLDGGTRPGDSVIVAARPGMGKTSFAITAARATEKAKLSTAIFSLEMKGVQLGMRMLCGEAAVSLKRARMGWMDDNEWKAITAAHMRLSQAGIHIFDERSVNLSSIRSAARHLATKLSKTDRPLGRIILDYIALPELPGLKREAKEIGDVAKGLRNLAGELGTDMILLSQITRDVEKRKPPRPIISDIAESGDLEEHSDIVLLLFRPEAYKIDVLEPYLPRIGTERTAGIAEVILPKQRNGDAGMDSLVRFNKAQARFEDLPPNLPNFEPEPQAEMAF